jgi:hypothetical protein
MVIRGFHLIRPAADLVTLLAGSDDDHAAYLLEPQLWQHVEHDRTSWGMPDYTKRVKKAFVVHIARLTREHAPELCGLLRLSDDPDDRDFDQWWTTERFIVDEELEEIEQQYGIKLPR